MKNRLPIRPVTKEELIQSYKTFWVGHYADEIRRLEESKKNMLNTRASPEKLKKSGYTDQQIEQLYLTIEQSAARHDKLVADLKVDRDKKIPVMDGMLSSMDDEQRRSPARTEHVNAMLCEPQKLLKETGTPLVTRDASYFDPALPKHVAQCFVVYLRPPRARGQNTSVDAVYDALTNSLDLDALKAMLGK